VHACSFIHATQSAHTYNQQSQHVSCWCLQAQPISSVAPQLPFQLLQLPGPLLTQVLQQLEQCSLTSTAVTCSTLHTAAVAAISKVAVRCRTQEQFKSFIKWLERHNTSLNSLEECSVTSTSLSRPCPYSLYSMPCRHLRQLCVPCARRSPRGLQLWCRTQPPCPCGLHGAPGLFEGRVGVRAGQATTTAGQSLTNDIVSWAQYTMLESNVGQGYT
jgi:hypothetical protein